MAVGTAGARRRGDPRSRSRRRGTVLEDAILQAAWDELAAVGYADLTMENVAARANTSKAVLYRRWPSRAELVIAAMQRHGPMLSGAVPDTGSLRGDVLALLDGVSRGVAAVGLDTILGLMAEVFQNAQLSSFLQARQAGLEAMTTILERAVERGEVRPEKLTPRIVSLPVDLVRHELFATRSAVPDKVLAEIVDEIFLPLVRV
jgi:AcrR family transcriptional regulator